MSLLVVPTKGLFLLSVVHLFPMPSSSVITVATTDLLVESDLAHSMEVHQLMQRITVACNMIFPGWMLPQIATVVTQIISGTVQNENMVEKQFAGTNSTQNVPRTAVRKMWNFLVVSSPLLPLKIITFGIGAIGVTTPATGKWLTNSQMKPLGPYKFSRKSLLSSMKPDIT